MVVVIVMVVVVVGVWSGQRGLGRHDMADKVQDGQQGGGGGGGGGEKRRFKEKDNLSLSAKSFDGQL